MSQRLDLGRHLLLAGWLLAVAFLVFDLITSATQAPQGSVQGTALSAPVVGLVGLAPGLLVLASAPEVREKDAAPGHRWAWAAIGGLALLVVAGFVFFFQIFPPQPESFFGGLWLVIFIPLLLVGFLLLVVAATWIAGLTAIKALWDLTFRAGERWQGILVLLALVSVVLGWVMWPPFGFEQASGTGQLLSILSTVLVPLSLLTVAVVGLNRSLGQLGLPSQAAENRFEPVE